MAFLLNYSITLRCPLVALATKLNKNKKIIHKAQFVTFADYFWEYKKIVFYTLLSFFIDISPSPWCFNVAFF